MGSPDKTWHEGDSLACQPKDIHVLSHYCVLSTQWFELWDLVIVFVCNSLQSATCVFEMVCKVQHKQTCSDTFGLNRLN